MGVIRERARVLCEELWGVRNSYHGPSCSGCKRIELELRVVAMRCAEIAREKTESDDRGHVADVLIRIRREFGLEGERCAPTG